MKKRLQKFRIARVMASSGYVTARFKVFRHSKFCAACGSTDGPTGKRHRRGDHHKYIYCVKRQDGMFLIFRKSRPDVEEKRAGDYLATCGRFLRSGAATDRPLRFASEREADRMAQRLNCGLPMFWQKWIAAGGTIIVAAEAFQALRVLMP